jgi:small nuclear ribonucleoprotein D2
MPKKGKKGTPMEKIRYLPKLFLRGDSIIYVLKNPK